VEAFDGLKKFKVAAVTICGNGSHFEKINPLKAQLHMAYDIPSRFHKV
jgi:hypothetical protein